MSLLLHSRLPRCSAHTPNQTRRCFVVAAATTRDTRTNNSDMSAGRVVGSRVTGRNLSDGPRRWGTGSLEACPGGISLGGDDDAPPGQENGNQQTCARVSRRGVCNPLAPTLATFRHPCPLERTALRMVLRFYFPPNHPFSSEWECLSPHPPSPSSPLAAQPHLSSSALTASRVLPMPAQPDPSSSGWRPPALSASQLQGAGLMLTLVSPMATFAAASLAARPLVLVRF